MTCCEPLERRALLNAGQLDTSFGAGGVLHVGSAGGVGLGNFVDAAVAPGGKLVVATREIVGPKGHHVAAYILRRFDPSGKSLDSTFGAGGSAQTPGTFSPPIQMLVQPDGAILLLLNDYSVLRITSGGAMDSSFGNAGVALLPNQGFRDRPDDFALAPDGRIAILGSFSDSFGIEMLTPAGAADNTFDGDGLLHLFAADKTTDQKFAAAIAFQSDGTLVDFANEYFYSADPLDPPSSAILDRIDAAGKVLSSTVASSADPTDLAIGPGDAIVTLTSQEYSTTFVNTVDRFLPDASAADPAFAAVTVDLDPSKMAVLDDGRVVLLGTDQATSTQYLVQRIEPQGKYDATFGTRGIVTLSALSVPVNTFPQTSLAVAGSDGSLLIGSADDAFAATLVRLQGDPTVRVTDGGSLIVGGMGGDDAIRVYRRRSDGRIVARVNDVARAFAPQRIRKIAVFAHAGNDYVEIAPRVPGAYIDGEEGNDTVVGGVFNDTILGGAGNDSLFGGAGRDKIFGGDGNDAIGGGGGNDYLVGGAQNDSIEGNGGADTLSGAGGQDLLHGGGDDSIDILLGGRGTDTASHDPRDIFRSIETLEEPVV